MRGERLALGTLQILTGLRLCWIGAANRRKLRERRAGKRRQFNHFPPSRAQAPEVASSRPSRSLRASTRASAGEESRSASTSPASSLQKRAAAILLVELRRRNAARSSRGPAPGHGFLRQRRSDHGGPACREPSPYGAHIHEGIAD